RSPVLRSRSPRYQGLPGPSFPDPLPPLHAVLRRRPIGVDRHLFADAVEVPAGELGQVSSLLLAPVAQLVAILLSGRAGIGALPFVPGDIAALEVGAVGGLLEDRVFGEV